MSSFMFPSEMVKPARGRLTICTCEHCRCQILGVGPMSLSRMSLECCCLHSCWILGFLCSIKAGWLWCNVLRQNMISWGSIGATKWRDRWGCLFMLLKTADVWFMYIEMLREPGCRDSSKPTLFRMQSERYLVWCCICNQHYSGFYFLLGKFQLWYLAWFGLKTVFLKQNNFLQK